MPIIASPAQESTARQRQEIAVRALADLLARDLPIVTWSVWGQAGVGKVEGQIPSYIAPQSVRVAMLNRWAEALDATVTRRHVGLATEHIEVSGFHLAAPVTVWTPFKPAQGEREELPARGTGECPDPECWGCTYCEGPTDAELAVQAAAASSGETR